MLPRTAPDWLYSFKAVNGKQIDPDIEIIMSESIQLKATVQDITDIQFLLAVNSPVTLLITDLQGKNICILLRNTKTTGIVNGDGKNRYGIRCPSGIYFMVLKTDNKSMVKPFIIVK